MLTAFLIICSVAAIVSLTIYAAVCHMSVTVTTPHPRDEDWETEYDRDYE